MYELARRYCDGEVRKTAVCPYRHNMFPSVEVDCGPFVVACPCCGSQIPCLDIRFIDARDKLSDEVRKRTGVHMPVYPEKCPVCGLDIVYDAGDEG